MDYREDYLVLYDPMNELVVLPWEPRTNRQDYNEFAQAVQSTVVEDTNIELYAPTIYDFSPNIPSLAHLPRSQPGPFIGQQSGAYAPDIRVFGLRGKPIDCENDDHRKLHVYSQSEPGFGRRQDQTVAVYMTSHPGPLTHSTSSTAVTDESSALQNDSTFSAPNLATPTVATSTLTSLAESSSREARPLLCPHADCEKRYKRKSDLTKHQRNHVPPDERPLQCGLCSQRFLYNKDVERHLYTHKASAHLCPTCGNLLKRPDHLKRHQETCGRSTPRTRPSRARSSSAAFMPIAPVPASSPNLPTSWMTALEAAGNGITQVDTPYSEAGQYTQSQSNGTRAMRMLSEESLAQRFAPLHLPMEPAPFAIDPSLTTPPQSGGANPPRQLDAFESLGNMDVVEPWNFSSPPSPSPIERAKKTLLRK